LQGFTPEFVLPHPWREIGDLASGVITDIPKDKARNFAASLTANLSGNYSESKIDMVESINRKLKGCPAFYQFVDHKAKIFSYIDGVVFWKLAHWLGHKVSLPAQATDAPLV
tara:strand:+ start:46 stop:381 length:336 start_codon:yes stop_codon:yes gene_type:complete